MDNYLDKSTGPLNRAFDFIYRLVIINVCFVLGTLVGLVFLGLFPALFTAFHVTKRWVANRDGDFSIPKTFVRYYKTHFLRTNVLGYIMALIIFISVIDLYYAYQVFFLSDEVSIFGILFSMFSILFVYVAFALVIYVPVTYVYFERFTTKEMLKFALISVLGTPVLTIKMLVITGLSMVFFSIFISVTLFLGVSLPLYLLFTVIRKRYRLFFVVKEENNLSYMNYKYMTDKDKIHRFFASYLDDMEAFDKDLLQNNALSNLQLNHTLSTVVLSQLDETLMGFILVKNYTPTQIEIEWLIVHKYLDRAHVMSELINTLIAQSKRLDIEVIYCSLNKEAYHSKLRTQAFLEEQLIQDGFKSEGLQRLKRIL